MKIEMRKFRIGALAEKLEVEKFVIRFWEKEFNIRPSRSEGKQRFYTEKDLEKFSTIKDLLYTKGYTIAGAKKHLKKKRSSTDTMQDVSQETATIVASQVTTMEPEILQPAALPESIIAQMLDLQQKLVKLRELL